METESVSRENIPDNIGNTLDRNGNYHGNLKEDSFKDSFSLRTDEGIIVGKILNVGEFAVIISVIPVAITKIVPNGIFPVYLGIKCQIVRYIPIHGHISPCCRQVMIVDIMFSQVEGIEESSRIIKVGFSIILTRTCN